MYTVIISVAGRHKKGKKVWKLFEAMNFCSDVSVRLVARATLVLVHRDSGGGEETVAHKFVCTPEHARCRLFLPRIGYQQRNVKFSQPHKSKYKISENEAQVKSIYSLLSVLQTFQVHHNPVVHG